MLLVIDILETLDSKRIFFFMFHFNNSIYSFVILHSQIYITSLLKTLSNLTSTINSFLTFSIFTGNKKTERIEGRSPRSSPILG